MTLTALTLQAESMILRSHSVRKSNPSLETADGLFALVHSSIFVHRISPLSPFDPVDMGVDNVDRGCQPSRGRPPFQLPPWTTMAKAVHCHMRCDADKHGNRMEDVARKVRSSPLSLVKLSTGPSYKSCL